MPLIRHFPKALVLSAFLSLPTAVWLGRVNALVGVLLVYVATRLVRG